MTDQAKDRFYGVDHGGPDRAYLERRAAAEQFVRNITAPAQLSAGAFNRAVDGIMKAIPPFNARAPRRPSDG